MRERRGKGGRGRQRASAGAARGPARRCPEWAARAAAAPPELFPVIVTSACVYPDPL